MVPQLKTTENPQVIYPDSDGKPMADNTKQFRWIMLQLLRPDGDPFATYTDIAHQLQQAEARTDQERQRAERLAARLRAAGIDPDQA